jgi:TIR domain/NACHT domain
VSEPSVPEGHAFISYVREDSLHVDHLQRALEAAGIPVWRDTASLWPGEDWRANIQRAITDDALAFIVCFSHRSLSRSKSYQNEELILAIEQLRQRRPDVPWLIPVRFDDCAIPDRDLGGSRTLASIQSADLFGEHITEQTARLVTAVLQILKQTSSPRAGSDPRPESPGATAGEAKDTSQVVRYLHDAATKHIPRQPMPVAWRAILPADEPVAVAEVVVASPAAVSEYFRQFHSHRMLLIGPVGSGKTVLAWRITLDVLKERKLHLLPVVLPIGSWDPFEEDFDRWLERAVADVSDEIGADLEASLVLPILDGLDEYSDQLRVQALTILSNGTYGRRPLIVIMRSTKRVSAEEWKYALADALTVELRPLPAPEIAQYIRHVVRHGNNFKLRSLADGVENGPDDAAARAISSAFMLDAVTNLYSAGFSSMFERALHDRDSLQMEEAIAISFLEYREKSQCNWSPENIRKWLSTIARTSSQTYGFRPNSLSLPAPISMLLLVVAAGLPATVMLLTMPALPLIAAAAIAVAYGVGLGIFGTYTENGPTVDPRKEIRIEFVKAKEKVFITFALTLSLGVLNLLLPYLGLWTMLVGAVLGAALSTVDAYRVRPRLIDGGLGALLGLIIGWSVYAGMRLGSSWIYVMPGLIAGGIVFIIVFGANFVGHVARGEGWQGLALAPFLGVVIALLVALWASSVSAIAHFSRVGFGSNVMNGATGVVIFALALAAAMITMTVWARIGATRLYYSARGVYPLRLLRFLDDFADLGVLRRYGAWYRFRHPAFQRALIPIESEDNGTD